MADLSYNEGVTIVIKWMAIVTIICSITWGVTETLDSKYKSDMVSSSMESFSKIMVACINSGQTDCDKKHEFTINTY